MPIELKCICGRFLNLPTDLAGKAIRCPTCSATLAVPMLAQVVDEIAPGLPVPSAPMRLKTASIPPPLPALADRETQPPDAPPSTGKKRRKRRRKSIFWDQVESEPQPLIVLNTRSSTGSLAHELFFYGMIGFPIIGGLFLGLADGRFKTAGTIIGILLIVIGAALLGLWSFIDVDEN